MTGKTYTYDCFGEKYKVQIRRGWYEGGRPALELVSDTEGPVSKITVNMPEVKLEPGEILVKTWSENEPMTDFLIKSGIAEDTGKRAKAGYAEAWVMRLLEKEMT